MNFKWLALIEIEDPPETETVRRQVPWAGAHQTVRRRWCQSGGEAFVAMMQPADLRDGDDSSDPRWLDRTWVRAILVERKVGARSTVVLDVRRQEAAQMPFVEDHKLSRNSRRSEPMTRSTWDSARVIAVR